MNYICVTRTGDGQGKELVTNATVSTNALTFHTSMEGFWHAVITKQVMQNVVIVSAFQSIVQNVLNWWTFHYDAIVFYTMLWQSIESSV